MVTPMGKRRRVFTYKYRWTNLVAIFLPLVVMVIHRVSIGVLVIPIQEEFNLTYGLAGILNSLYFLPYFILQLPSGLAADKFSARKLVPLSTFFLGIGGILFATMPSIEVGFVARIIMGSGGAFVSLPGLRTVYQWFKKSERGKALGLFTNAGGFGNFIALGVLPFLFVILDWRIIYWILTIPVFIVAIVAYLLIRDSPEEVDFETMPTMDFGEEGQQSHEVTRISHALRTILRNKYTWPLVLGTWFISGVVWSMNFWMPSILVREKSLSIEFAGIFMILYSIGSLIGRPLMGLLFDSDVKKGYGRKRILLIGVSIYVVLLTLFILPVHWFVMYLLGFTFGIIDGVRGGPLLMIAEMFPIQWAGTASAFLNCAIFCAAFVWPIIFGFMWDIMGTGFWIIVIMVILSIIALLFYKLGEEKFSSTVVSVKRNMKKNWVAIL